MPLENGHFFSKKEIDIQVAAHKKMRSGRRIVHWTTHRVFHLSSDLAALYGTC